MRSRRQAVLSWNYNAAAAGVSGCSDDGEHSTLVFVDGSGELPLSADGVDDLRRVGRCFD